MCLVALAIKYFFVISNHSVTTRKTINYSRAILLLLLLLLLLSLLSLLFASGS